MFYMYMYANFKLERLRALDLIFFYDKHQSQNQVTALLLPKYQFGPMKEFILSKTEDYHRFRKILVREFGMFWMQQIDEESFRQKYDPVVLKEAIRSREELVEFMDKEI